MSSAEQPSGFQFPCTIPVKAMGRSGETFRSMVVEVIEQHVSVVPEQVRSRTSGSGNFQSVTVTVEMASREQMEAIYADLAECEEVLWTL
ncbi:MAG: DUF493 domain-containing protein [Xanthomonadales bacterium]|nr:DUF493 domain-containing protein [Xanthomonadales bacterium]